MILQTPLLLVTFLASQLLKSSSQPTFTCSKLTIEALGQGVKHVQS